jgi:hypothetical protein
MNGRDVEAHRLAEREVAAAARRLADMALKRVHRVTVTMRGGPTNEDEQWNAALDSYRAALAKLERP